MKTDFKTTELEGSKYRTLIIRAFEGDKCIGSVNLELSKDQNIGRVSKLLTLGPKGRGTGTSLLRRAEALARRSGAQKLELAAGRGWTNSRTGRKQPLKAFYSKRGYSPTKSMLRRTVMQKVLKHPRTRR